MKLAFLLWLASSLPQPAADQVCLATTVYLEARSESQVGQMAVAEVAMRRRDAGHWGSTVCTVVRAPNQFAITTTNTNFKLDNPDAWRNAVLRGDSASPVLVDDVVRFLNQLCAETFLHGGGRIPLVWRRKKLIV